MDEYNYRLEPYAAQREAFRRGYGKKAFAYLMDQGTGKTKVALDEALNLFLSGSITSLVVIAPNGVHGIWVDEELPKHALPEVPVTAVVWDGKNTIKKRREIDTLFNADGSLKMLAVNIEAFQRSPSRENRAFQLVKRLLVATRGMLAVDESQDIKTPGANRTRMITNLGRYAIVRRILTGTVMTQHLLDFYAQFGFLDREIIGMRDYGAFKAHYAVFQQRSTGRQRYNKRSGQYEDITFEALLGYRNVDELMAKVSPYCFRVEKREALPDLPDKIYLPVRRLPLSPAQKKLYNELMDEGVAYVREGIEDAPTFETLEEELWYYCVEQGVPKIVADNALTVVNKLRQVCGGVVRDKDGVWQTIEERPPKLEALLTDIEHSGEPAIIWCAYQEECELVASALRYYYGEHSAVIYSGRYRDEERTAAKIAFTKGNARFFVTSYAAARGHTLTKATCTYYYSVHPSVEKRMQSEDRNHRAGAVGVAHNGRQSVLYTDYVVSGTVDARQYANTMKAVNFAREQMSVLKSSA